MKKIAWMLALLMLVASALPAFGEEAATQPAETPAQEEQVTKADAAQALRRQARRFAARFWQPHHEFVDEDEDGLCDLCKLPREMNEKPWFVDEDGDGICDNCNKKAEDGECRCDLKAFRKFLRRARLAKGRQFGPGPALEQQEGDNQPQPGQGQGPGRRQDKQPRKPGRFRR